MRDLRFAAAATVIPVAAAISVALWLSRPGKLSPLGDEPHYLVMADAVSHDFSFDLRNAYAREERTHRIYGDRLNPHVIIINHRWSPYHEPGLAMLLAVPYLVGGAIGAKLALCMMAGLMAWALFAWLNAYMKPPDAAWLTVGLMVSLPIGFGASQIYPDLPAGIVVMVLTLWLWRLGSKDRVDEVGPEQWAAFWVATGLLPWLNAKFLVATAVLALGAFGVLYRKRERPPPKAVWVTSSLVAIGLGTLAAYHWWAAGTLVGVRDLDELRAWPLRALMIFLGLHFDQAQGMFFQQPLLVGGVAAFVPFARRHPRFALFWMALYAALILPNSFELARYGGGGPAGRFGWTAEWLWIIPLGWIVAEYPERSAACVRAAVVSGIAYQLLLALRWLPVPITLFTDLNDTLDTRNSLFPAALRSALPSFYFWDFQSYLTYAPNIVAYVAFIVLMGAGVLYRTSRHSPEPSQAPG